MSLMVKINVALREQFCEKFGSERVKEGYTFSQWLFYQEAFYINITMKQ